MSLPFRFLKTNSDRLLCSLLTGGKSMLKKNQIQLWLCSLLLIVAYSSLAFSQEKKEKKVYTGTAVMWTEPADIASRNLLLGAGGETMKPDLSRVIFVEDKPGGYSKKYRVKDGAGNEWVAKIGKEAQTDTAANRLVWALGYETEIAYLIPKLKIEGKGEFENVRLEARPKDVKRTGTWSWESNKFSQTNEFNGLKIIMLMINNWDMKDDNNQILASKKQPTGGQMRYIVSDLGGSFGKTGGFFSRTRNEPDDYAKTVFIERVNGNLINFKYEGKNQKLFANLTTAHAKWLSDLLGRLSDEQIKDAFRSANYTPAEVDQLAAAFRARANALADTAK